MYNFLLTNRQQIFVIISTHINRHCRRFSFFNGWGCKDKTTPVKGFSFVPPLTGVVQSLQGWEKKKTIFCFFLPIINKLKKELHKSSSNLLNTLLCDNQYFAMSSNGLLRDNIRFREEKQTTALPFLYLNYNN